MADRIDSRLRQTINMKSDRRGNVPDSQLQDPEQRPSQEVDPNDTDRLKNQIRGQTKEHADPPRLEDEGQSGG